MENNDPSAIQDYNPDWPNTFSELAARIAAALAGLVVTIEHVGSTAVPGLAAKPIIDLDVIVPSRTDIEAAIALLGTTGYSHQGNLGIAGREAFRSPPGEPAHHLYLLSAGAEELRRHLAFRDALRADDELRDRYAALKRILARTHWQDRKSYTEAKAAFITSAMAKIEAS